MSKLKSCRNCKNYIIKETYCTSFKMRIIDPLCATVCKNYYDKSKLQKTKVQCKNCKNLNKYNWCLYKKVCLNDTEKYRDRSCRNFRFKTIKPKRKKY